MDTPCEIWPKSVGSHGYGQTFHNGKVSLAHRVAWEKAFGPIPGDLTIDHICRNKRCVNVAHLRLLTRSENARNSHQLLKTHCPRGHSYAGANLILTKKGHRQCRECARMWARENYQQRKSQFGESLA